MKLKIGYYLASITLTILVTFCSINVWAYGNQQIANNAVAGTSMYATQGKEISSLDAEKLLKTSEYANTKLLYGGFYESSATDRSLTISICESDKPVVLFLNSFRPVIWHINNPYKVPIKAIFYTSYMRGTTIEGIDSSTHLYVMNDLIFSYSFGVSYNKYDYTYHIESSDFPKLIQQIQQIAGRKYDGFSLQYSAGATNMPNIVMNDALYSKVEAHDSRITRLAEKSPIAFENLFTPQGIVSDDSWGKYLNTTNEVPVNKFKAFYFDVGNPSNVLKQEYRDYPSVHYESANFLNLWAEDFCGYWVGDFEYAKDTLKGVYIQNGESKVRVIIDGKAVVTTSTESILPYTFTKGKHRIEVEFINDCSLAAFSVMMLDPCLIELNSSNYSQKLNVLSGDYLNSDNNAGYTFEFGNKSLYNNTSYSEDRGASYEISNVIKTGINNYDLRVSSCGKFGSIHIRAYTLNGNYILDIHPDIDLPFPCITEDFEGIFIKSADRH